MSTKLTAGINGQWVNSYGSLMTIQQFSNGLIWGEYSSTTGSSGTYLVLGFSPYGSTGNQPISLCIYWRSLKGGSGDPTWNWVSMLCGQILTDAPDGPQLELLHGMIASAPFNIIEVYGPGAYTETLIFTPYTGKSALVKQKNPFKSKTELSTILTGQWKNKRTNSNFPTLNLKTYSPVPLVDGTLLTKERIIMIGGLYNMDAAANALQTIAFTGNYSDKNGHTAALAAGGYYDPVKAEMDLILFKSIKTTYVDKYACTNILGGEHFVKQ